MAEDRCKCKLEFTLNEVLELLDEIRRQEQFISLVASMRLAQKEYFRRRLSGESAGEALSVAKAYEERVDRLLILIQTPDLFKEAFNGHDQPDQR